MTSDTDPTSSAVPLSEPLTDGELTWIEENPNIPWHPTVLLRLVAMARRVVAMETALQSIIDDEENQSEYGLALRLLDRLKAVIAPSQEARDGALQ